ALRFGEEGEGGPAFRVVRGVGVDPTLCHQNWILSPARLPVPPRPRRAISSGDGLRRPARSSYQRASRSQSSRWQILTLDTSGRSSAGVPAISIGLWQVQYLFGDIGQ